jgi:hypothetical protein
MQSLVYGTPVARIAVAAGNIREMPGNFQRVQHNMARGAEHSMKLAVAILNNFYKVKRRYHPIKICILSEKFCGP